MTANVGWQLTQFFVGWMVLAVLVTAGVCWLIRRYPPPDICEQVADDYVASVRRGMERR